MCGAYNFFGVWPLEWHGEMKYSFDSYDSFIPFPIGQTMEALAAANANFSLELFKKITEITKAKNTGNVFYSPLSISSALAMVSLGAKGNTEVQMHEVSSQCTQFSEAMDSFTQGNCIQCMM